jgi:hypothetical protein
MDGKRRVPLAMKKECTRAIARPASSRYNFQEINAMDKINMQVSVNEVFGLKRAAIEKLETLSLSTLAAKVALENAKADAANLSGWAEQKNDKSRDSYLRLVCAEAFANYDKAVELERTARHQLTLTELEVERLRLIIKINCEWQDA